MANFNSPTVTQSVSDYLYSVYSAAVQALFVAEDVKNAAKAAASEALEEADDAATVLSDAVGTPAYASAYAAYDVAVRASFDAVDAYNAAVAAEALALAEADAAAEASYGVKEEESTVSTAAIDDLYSDTAYSQEDEEEDTQATAGWVEVESTYEARKVAFAKGCANRSRGITEGLARVEEALASIQSAVDKRKEIITAAIVVYQEYQQ